MDPGSVSIEFHGGASWLYNLFDDYLEDALKANMQSQVSMIISRELFITKYSYARQQLRPSILRATQHWRHYLVKKISQFPL